MIPIPEKRKVGSSILPLTTTLTVRTGSLRPGMRDRRSGTRGRRPDKEEVRCGAAGMAEACGVAFGRLPAYSIGRLTGVVLAWRG